MRGGGGLKRRDRFYGHRSFRQQREQFRKFWLHLRDVAAEIIEDLLGGRRNILRIGLQRRAERSHIREAFFFGDNQHLRLDALYFA